MVLFDDTPSTVTGTTAVNIADNGGVNPSSVTFNNSISSYTISSTAAGNVGITSGALIKNGTATVTMNTVNSYSGGTTLNAGMFNLGTASAIGSGTLTLGGGGLEQYQWFAAEFADQCSDRDERQPGTFGDTNALNLGSGGCDVESDVNDHHQLGRLR